MLCVWILGAVSISHAQEDQRIPAKLDEAIAVALHNRLELVIASKQNTSAEIRIKVAKEKFLPRVSLAGSTRYLRSFDKFSGIEADALLGTQNFHVSVQKVIPAYEVSAGLDLNYNLYSGGRDAAAVEESVADQAAQQYDEAAIKDRISLEVMNAYWALRKSQIFSRLAERAYLHARRVLLIAETRKSTGFISEIDVETETLSVKETMLAAMLAVANARREEARNLAKYRESLGLFQSSSTGSVSLIDDPEKLTDAGLPAAADRPETLKTRSEMRAAEARLRQSKAVYYPTVDLFANYRMIGRDNDDYFKSTRINSDYYAVGVNVSFTLFDGFKERIALANSEKDIARLRVLQTIQQLDTQNRDRINEKEKFLNELHMAEQRLNLYGMKKQLAEEKFRNGKIAEIELFEADKEYDDFADKFLISKIDLAVAQQAISMNNRTN